MGQKKVYRYIEKNRTLVKVYRATMMHLNETDRNFKPRPGRKNKIDSDQLKEIVSLRNEGLPIIQICKKFSLARSTYFKYMKLAKTL